MGLDTSHGCWHGSYGAFMRWRETVAQAAGLPPLMLMEGFYEPFRDEKESYDLPTLYYGIETLKTEYLRNIDKQLPIKWECLKPSPLHAFLHHSDCDGEIPWEDCENIANELEKLLPEMPDGDAGGHIGNWRDKTKTFIDGLRLAFNKKENVDFH